VMAVPARVPAAGEHSEPQGKQADSRGNTHCWTHDENGGRGRILVKCAAVKVSQFAVRAFWATDPAETAGGLALLRRRGGKPLNCRVLAPLSGAAECGRRGAVVTERLA
jgi:hypothetical protein